MAMVLRKWRKLMPKGSVWYERAKTEEQIVKAEMEARARSVKQRYELLKRALESR
jgi:hypothetical protein